MIHDKQRMLERFIAATGVVTFPLGVLLTLLFGWAVGLAVFAIGWFLVLPASIVYYNHLKSEGTVEYATESTPL